MYYLFDVTWTIKQYGTHRLMLKQFDASFFFKLSFHKMFLETTEVNTIIML